MKYTILFPGGPEVSKLSMGSVPYGTKISKEDAFKQMDLFVEMGGNFLDTAHVYAEWLPGGYLASEKTIGAWIKERKMKGKMVISTKGAHPRLATMEISRLNKKELGNDINDSLQSLNLDAIDLYFLHRDDPSVPVDEILFWLEGHKKEGKIKHYGCSNWKLDRVIEADRVSARSGYEGFVCNQIMWGIGDIRWSGIKDKTLVPMDSAFFDYHLKSQKGAMAYSSSCKGYFSKKKNGSPIPDNMEKIYGVPSNADLSARLEKLSASCGCTVAVLVSAYIMNQNFPAVPIASFSSLPQIEESIAACDFVFPPGIVDEIRQSRKYLW